MKLNIGIISLFPEMFDALNSGIVGRAQRRELLSLTHYNPRNFTTDTYHRVDDRPYGGGPGMVMLYEPLKQSIDAAKKELGNKSKVIHLSPQGKPLTQQALENFPLENPLILLASRYEGVDQRLIDQEVDEEYSIGDYVLSGGELPAMILIDGLVRLLPDALGHPESATQDSFSDGLLDCPHYTRPEEIANQKVPPVLLSGDHAAITRWRLQQSLGNTWQKRPDLIKIRTLTELEQKLLNEYIIGHYSHKDDED